MVCTGFVVWIYPPWTTTVAGYFKLWTQFFWYGSCFRYYLFSISNMLTLAPNVSLFVYIVYSGFLTEFWWSLLDLGGVVWSWWPVLMDSGNFLCLILFSHCKMCTLAPNVSWFVYVVCSVFLSEVVAAVVESLWLLFDLCGLVGFR